LLVNSIYSDESGAAAKLPPGVSDPRRSHGLPLLAGPILGADCPETVAHLIEYVLWNDPASGVIGPADAGYDDVPDCACGKTRFAPKISWIL